MISRLLLLASGVVVTQSGFVALASSPASTENQIIALEKEWAAAIQAKDVPAMSHFLADGYFLGAGVQGGTIMTMPREGWLKNLAAYDTKSYNIDDIKVHVYGKTAVVLMLFSQVANLNGDDLTAQFQITDIWVKTPIGWRVAERHSSRPRPTAPQKK